MAERVNFSMGFIANNSQRITLNLPRAISTYSTAQAEKTMEDIIESGIVLINGGRPVGIDSAEIVITTVTRKL